MGKVTIHGVLIKMRKTCQQSCQSLQNQQLVVLLIFLRTAYKQTIENNFFFSCKHERRNYFLSFAMNSNFSKKERENALKT